jgi:hypothetical protein
VIPISAIFGDSGRRNIRTGHGKPQARGLDMKRLSVIQEYTAYLDRRAVYLRAVSAPRGAPGYFSDRVSATLFQTAMKSDDDSTSPRRGNQTVARAKTKETAKDKPATRNRNRSANLGFEAQLFLPAGKKPPFSRERSEGCTMIHVVIENPIINSPFDEPTRHFRLSDEGITNEIVDGRRTSSYFVPIAKPKKKGSEQLQLRRARARDSRAARIRRAPHGNGPRRLDMPRLPVSASAGRQRQKIRRVSKER